MPLCKMMNGSMTKAREIIRKRALLHISRRELAVLAGVMQRTLARMESGAIRKDGKVERMVDEALLKLPIPSCFGDADGRCPLRKPGSRVPTVSDCYLCELSGRKRGEI